MEGGGEATKSKDSSSPAPPALKKGPWTAEEDAILIEHVRRNGEGNWNSVQRSTGLARCGKSCRLRWANHLRPNLKKGQLTPEEELLVLRLHAQLGNKWARMAAQLPGRTDNEIKNYWNTRLKRRQRAGMPLYPPGILHCHRPPPLLIPSTTTTTTALAPLFSSPVLSNSTMMFSTLSTSAMQQLSDVPRGAKRARVDDGMTTTTFRFPVSPAPSVVPRIWHTAPPTPTGRTMFDYTIVPPKTPPMPPLSAYSMGIEMWEHSSSSHHVLDGGGEVELMDKLLQEEARRAAVGDHHALNCAGGEAFVGLEELDYCSSTPFPTNYSHESNHLWIGDMIPTQQHEVAAAASTPADWNNSDRSDISNGGQSVLTNDDLTVDQHQLAPSSSPTTLRWNQTGTISPRSSDAPDWNFGSCHWDSIPDLA